jgi:hypothetical protein
MRKVILAVDVWVLEASDVGEVSDRSRVEGALGESAAAIREAIPTRPDVQIGLRDDPQLGTLPIVRVGGQRLEVGDGLAIHPILGGGMAHVDAILLLDATEAKADVAVAEAEARAAHPAGKAAVKKTVKKAVKKAK